MTFLHPILLGAGVACVAIPILIHFLMRRRRKPVRWAAMRFVIEAYKQQRRRLRLEQLMLLAARCLLIALIAVGVARPLLGGGPGDAPGARELVLLVDTGISAATQDPGGRTDLARSIEAALATLESLDAGRGDRAGLIALGAPARAVVMPPTADLALVERRLRELEPTDAGTDLTGGLAEAAPAADPAADSEPDPTDAAPRRTVALFSGFREGVLGAASAAPGPLLIQPPAEAVGPNAGVAGVDVLRPVVLTGSESAGARASQVRVRLIRSGAEDAASTPVRIAALREGSLRQVGVGSVAWSPGQQQAEALVDVDLAGMQGRIALRVELEPDANERDNVGWAALEVRERLRVAVVGARRFGARPRLSDFGPTDWLALALAPAGDDGRAQIQTETLDAARLGGSELADFDAAIVAEPARVREEGWNALARFAEAGGAVVLAASPAVGAQLWTEAAAEALRTPWTVALEPVETETGELRAAEPEGEDPLWYIRGELDELARGVSVARLLEVEPGTAQVAITTTPGAPVLLLSEGGPERRGFVALLATAIDLDWTDLPAKPLMVPLVQELVRASGVGAGPGRAAVAGGTLPAPADAVELAALSGTEVIPVAGDRTGEPVRRAGVYAARDRAGGAVGSVVVQPDALAARVDPTSRERVATLLSGQQPGEDAPPLTWIGDAPEYGAAAGPRSSTAPGPGLAVLLAAACLACVELWLARIASHARVGGPTAAAGRAAA